MAAVSEINPKIRVLGVRINRDNREAYHRLLEELTIHSICSFSVQQESLAESNEEYCIIPVTSGLFSLKNQYP